MRRFINSWHNVSLGLAVLTGLLAPLSIYYFAKVYDGSLFVWSDFVLALAWCVGVFCFSFRSPLYWHLGSFKGYKLTAQSAYGVGYARRHNL